jgi:hypothetical protein
MAQPLVARRASRAAQVASEEGIRLGRKMQVGRALPLEYCDRNDCGASDPLDILYNYIEWSATYLKKHTLILVLATTFAVRAWLLCCPLPRTASMARTLDDDLFHRHTFSWHLLSVFLVDSRLIGPS